MTDKHNPDKVMAGMLKRKGVWPGATPGEACPDAATLAAYFERTLSETEVGKWESHFSSCARCQEQLAALVRSEPSARTKSAEAKKPAFTWLWDWRFLAPVGAAVVVLAFVVSYRTMQAPLTPTSSGELVAKRDTVASAPAISTPQKSQETSTSRSQDAAVSTPKSHALSDQDKGKIAADELKLKKETADGIPGRTSQEFKDKNALAARGGSGAITAPASAKPADQDRNIPASENRVVAQTEAAKTQVRANEAARPQAAQEAAPPAPAAQTQERAIAGADTKEQAAVPPSTMPASNPALARQKATAEKQAATESLAVMGAARQPQSKMLLAPSELILATSKSGVLWRFKDSGRIERTQDGGKTWKQQKNPSQQNILAASAPTESICWAGGSNGLLLRTTDGGENWEVILSPTKLEILVVKARDQFQVTVVDANGRTYETLNAGKQWRTP